MPYEQSEKRSNDDQTIQKQINNSVAVNNNPFSYISTLNIGHTAQLMFNGEDDRLSMEKLDASTAQTWAKIIFQKRVDNQTATTGKHNYALDIYTDRIERSSGSAHAELLLAAMSNAEEGTNMALISEYKPCKHCQDALDKVAKARRLFIRVLYIFDYAEKGDGDVDVTRNYYKSIGLLEGGGDYTYRLTQQV